MAFTTHLLRHINAMRVLRLLRGGAVLSRAEIARRLGLTRATAGNATAALLTAELVREVETNQSHPRVGRPGVGISLNPEGAYAFGVEIGTRQVKMLLLNLAGGVVHQCAEGLHDVADPGSVIAQIRERLLNLKRTVNADPDRIIGAGVAIPGLVDKTGTVVNAPFLGWRDVAFHSELASGLPEGWMVRVLNDASCFAVVESAETPCGDVLLVLLNEGIGGAVVHDGRVQGGGHGYAGEIGHMIITAADRTDTFEMLAGTAWFDPLFGANRPDAEAVAELLRRRDEPGVHARLDQWAATLALGLANAVHLIDPQEIILGGALAQLYPAVAAQVEAALNAHLIHGFSRPEIRLSDVSDAAVEIGAARGVLDTLFDLPALDQDITEGETKGRGG